MSSKLRLVILLSGLLLAAGLAYTLSAAFQTGPAATSGVQVGGPFTLTDHTGVVRRAEDFRGKVVAIYFGYTHCPDACPTALSALSDALDQLGPRANEVAALFVTIDPARDTVALLKDYIGSFHASVVGLTGTAEQVAQAAKGWRVYYRRSGEGADYTMDHSSVIFIMGRDGRYLEHFTHSAPADQMAAALTRALAR